MLKLYFCMELSVAFAKKNHYICVQNNSAGRNEIPQTSRRKPPNNYSAPRLVTDGAFNFKVCRQVWTKRDVPDEFLLAHFSSRIYLARDAPSSSSSPPPTFFLLRRARAREEISVCRFLQDARSEAARDEERKLYITSSPFLPSAFAGAQEHK
jgi:hypothetical protein